MNFNDYCTCNYNEGNLSFTLNNSKSTFNTTSWRYVRCEVWGGRGTNIFLYFLTLTVNQSRKYKCLQESVWLQLTYIVIHVGKISWLLLLDDLSVTQCDSISFELVAGTKLTSVEARFIISNNRVCRLDKTSSQTERREFILYFCLLSFESVSQWISQQN